MTTESERSEDSVIAPKVGLSVQREPESRRDRSSDHPDADEGETRTERSGAWRDPSQKGGGSDSVRSRQPAAGDFNLFHTDKIFCKQITERSLGKKNLSMTNRGHG